MECPKCKSGDLQRPAKPRAFEIFTCRKCGEESAIHNHYPIADEFRSKHKIFRGMYFVTEANALKDFIKLKNILRKCFWFELSQLEAQYLDEKKVWELGTFLDTEVEQIRLACQNKSIEILFEQVEDD